MKRTLLTFGAALAPVLGVLAEGEQTPVYDQAITQTQTTLTNAISSMAPAALAIISVGIGVWLIPKVVRVIKRAFSAAA